MDKAARSIDAKLREGRFFVAARFVPGWVGAGIPQAPSRDATRGKQTPHGSGAVPRQQGTKALRQRRPGAAELPRSIYLSRLSYSIPFPLFLPFLLSPSCPPHEHPRPARHPILSSPPLTFLSLISSLLSVHLRLRKVLSAEIVFCPRLLEQVHCALRPRLRRVSRVNHIRITLILPHSLPSIRLTSTMSSSDDDIPLVAASRSSRECLSLQPDLGATLYKGPPHHGHSIISSG